MLSKVNKLTMLQTDSLYIPRYTIFPKGQIGTLVNRKKFVPEKYKSLKKGLHFESV